MFIEVLCRSLPFSIRKCYVASEGATLQNLVNYATFVFKLLEGSIIGSITTQVENRIHQRPLINKFRELHATAMKPIANRCSFNCSSSSEEVPPNRWNHSKRRSHTLKMSMTPQKHVSSITPRIPVPQQYASRYPTNSGYFHFCLDARQRPAS